MSNDETTAAEPIVSDEDVAGHAKPKSYTDDTDDVAGHAKPKSYTDDTDDVAGHAKPKSYTDDTDDVAGHSRVKNVVEPGISMPDSGDGMSDHAKI